MILLSAISTVMLALFANPAPSTAYIPEPAVQKKTGPKGALWQFTGTNAKADKQISFEYYARDSVLYHAKTDALIGKVEAIEKNASRVILNNKSPFPSTFRIRREEGGGPVWNGTATYKDEEMVDHRAATQLIGTKGGNRCQEGNWCQA